jgi:hypothetical protein
VAKWERVCRLAHDQDHDLDPQSGGRRLECGVATQKRQAEETIRTIGRDLNE